MLPDHYVDCEDIWEGTEKPKTNKKLIFIRFQKCDWTALDSPRTIIEKVTTKKTASVGDNASLIVLVFFQTLALLSFYSACRLMGSRLIESDAYCT